MTHTVFTWSTIKTSIFVTLGIAVAYVLVTTAVDSRFREIELNIRAHIAEQESVLIAIAETTARNGADAVTESIVRDCSVDERERFDSLLGRLDAGVSSSDLSELERLFGRCGAFYSERKALMVARLAREVEIFEDYVRHLGIVTDADLSTVYAVERWHSLVAEEQKQSVLFRELVRLQNDIITALLAGSTIESEAMADILYQVREVQETLVVANRQASTIRSELVPI